MDANRKQSVDEYDVREDEEQNVKFNEIIDLLVAAGYFRARIKGLSAFDKVVGGMIWSMDSCNFDDPSHVQNGANEHCTNGDSASKRFTVGPGPIHSHGVKLSTTMSSMEKQDLLLKLKEWREKKWKRTALAKVNVAQTSSNKPSKFSQVTKNKENIPAPVKQDKPNFHVGRESVFDRLYKNAKKPDKGALKLSLSDNTPVKPPIKNLEKPNKDVGVENIRPLPPVHMPVKEKREPGQVLQVPNLLQNVKMSNLSEAITNELVDHGDSVVQQTTLKSGGPKEIVNDLPGSKPSDFNTPLKHCMLPPQPVKAEFESSSTQSKSGHVGTIKGGNLMKPPPSPACSDGAKQNAHMKLPNESISSVNKLVKLPEKLKPVRQSISTMYRKKTGIYRANSEKNLQELKYMRREENVIRGPYTFEDTLGKKNKITFKNLPITSPGGSSTDTCSKSLRTKLNDWLKLNGHCTNKYRHLRCFGIPQSVVSAISESRDQVENSLPDVTSESEEKENPLDKTTAVTDITEAENWLKDLHKLIVEVKYPLDRCHEWLTAIKRKCPDSMHLPAYWECLTAFNDPSNKADPVEMSQPAEEPANTETLKEVDAVGDSLAKLFDQMAIEHQKPSTGKLEAGLNPSNIFKSTVIKFCVQEKHVKESSAAKTGEDVPSSSTFVATPVRRSTRLQTPHKNNIVNSLRSLTPEVRNNVTFKTNKCLLNSP